MFSKIITNTKAVTLRSAQKIGAFLVAPTARQTQFVLFGAGVALLTIGLSDALMAQVTVGGGVTIGSGGRVTGGGITVGIGGGATGGIYGAGSSGPGLTTLYNDVRMSDALNAILTYVEGTYGAMIMVASGIGAIMSSAFGQYRSALGLMVVSVGAFILRSLVSTFFNDVNIRA